MEELEKIVPRNALINQSEHFGEY